MTLQIRGVEDAVTALHTRLLAGLPDTIDAINAAHADDEVLPTPEEQYIYDHMPSAGGLQAFPAVTISHGPGIFTDDSGWSATGQYDLLVTAFVQHSDQRILAQWVRRFHLALLRSILNDPVTGRPTRNLGVGDGVPWSVQVKAMDFGPSLGQQPGNDEPFTAFLTWTTLIVTVKLDED